MVKAAPSSAMGRRRRAWEESDEDEPIDRQPDSSPARDNSTELQDNDAGVRDNNVDDDED